MNATVKRILKWSAIVIGVVVIGIPLLLFAINAFDEELKPEAIAFADLSDDNVPDKDNGFYAWVGLGAPVGIDPHTLGIKVVAQINAREIPDSPETIANPNTLLGNGAIPFHGNLNQVCGRDSHDCLKQYRTRSDDIRNLLRDNQILLSRYRTLYRYPQFRETIKPHLRMPMFYHPAQVTALVRGQNALMALDGNVPGALQALREDSRYWRRILGQSRGLVNRMLAVANLQRNAQVVSEIVAGFRLDAASLQTATEIAQPLLPPEWDMEKVLRYEFGFGLDVFTHMHEYNAMDQTGCTEKSWFECATTTRAAQFFLKPNATLNNSYEIFVSAVAANKLPASKFIRAAHGHRRMEEERPEWPWCWHCAYNPLGKLFPSSVTLYDGYTGRIHNLDGFLRLVTLQINARKLGIRDAGMEKFLANSPAELRDPYTGEPMRWDTQARALHFNGYTDKSDATELLGKRIEVRL